MGCRETVQKGQSPFGTKGLQSAARIICSLKANKFHTCRLILKPVKKLEKLFIAPKVRQVLYETPQRVFPRCACAQRTGFLIKFFNQESVSELKKFWKTCDCKRKTPLMGFFRNDLPFRWRKVSKFFDSLAPPAGNPARGLFALSQ